MTKPNDKLKGVPEDVLSLLMEYTRNSKADVLRFIGAAEACGYKFVRDDLAPTSQWRDIKDASHNEHWILACNDELTHSFTAAWINRHKCFLDWNGDKIKVTHWQPLPAPPTKDLADAEKEGV